MSAYLWIATAAAAATLVGGSPVTTVVAGICNATVSAQSQPSFDGEWVLSGSIDRPSVAATGDAAFRRGDMGSGWGSPLSITQTADSLIVEFTHFSAYDLQPRLRYAYALNGAESYNRVMIGHTEAVQRSRVEWNGVVMVISTVHEGPGPPARPVTVRRTLSLESPTSLAIETTRAAADGTSTNTVRTTYTRRQKG